MTERTDLHIVRHGSPVCLDCFEDLTPGIPGVRCRRCLAAFTVEALTAWWSPEDRQALARVIDLVNMTVPPEDVESWWAVLGAVAAQRA